MPIRAYGALRDRMADVTGVVMLIGAAETGKTTLAKLLVLDALDKGMSVAYVDGDVASTVAGPPACVGLKFVEAPSDHYVIDYRYVEILQEETDLMISHSA